MSTQDRGWRSSRVWRVMLAGPLVFLLAILVMAGSVVWYPPGPAGIDNIVVPLIAFPLIWALLFFYACLAHSLRRAYVLLTGLGLIHLILVWWQMQYGGGI